MATAAVASTGNKVGFWRRFAAIFVDFVILAIVNQVVASSLTQGDITGSSTISTVIGIAYYVGLWVYWNGQTLGMKALGIKVVKTDGSPLDLVSGIIRYVGLIVSCVVFFIGVIWVAFDANKQGWHDKMANTYVVTA